MAQELRTEILAVTTADGTTTSNAAAEFRNDSSTIISIRGLNMTHELQTAAINEHAHAEISKSPTFASNTNNNVFFTRRVNAAARGGAADGASDESDKDKFGKGQVTLEPNESLFVNVSKTSGGASEFRAVIDYEF